MSMNIFDPERQAAAEPPSPPEIALRSSLRWRVRRGAQEWTADGTDELRKWAKDGKIDRADYIDNPILGSTMYARDVEEIASIFRATEERTARRKRNSEFGSAFLVFGFLGVASCVFLNVFVGAFFFFVALICAAFVRF